MFSLLLSKSILIGTHKEKTISIVTGAVFLMICYISTAYGADIYIKTYDGKNKYMIDIHGTIEEGDSEKFKDVLSTIKSERKAAPFVFLASRGGDITEAIRIGLIVRDNLMETWAPWLYHLDD